MSKKRIADVNTTISGIPCGIILTKYFYMKGNYSQRAVDPGEYYGEESISFDVLDRKGYTANWLADKMNDQDVIDIEELLRENMACDEEDYYG